MDTATSTKTKIHVYVRPTVLKDRDEVIRIGRRMHNESYFRDFDYSPQKIVDLHFKCLHEPNYFGRVFVTKANNIVGYFCGAVTEHYFGHDKMAIDLGLYIEPPFRGMGGLAVIKCLRDYERWAIDQGVVDVSVGVSADITNDQAIELYQRMGYTKGDQMLHKKTKVLSA